ncbi:MAG: hypothetical protein AAF191_16085 [Verrucomicrobiota bacterium]
MKSLQTPLFLASFLLILGLGPLHGSGGDEFDSFWKCSDGNTYGLFSEGNRRDFHLPSVALPRFLSGVKKGDQYKGKVYVGGKAIAVKGPVSNDSARVTLRAEDRRVWILNFSHR